MRLLTYAFETTYAGNSVGNGSINSCKSTSLKFLKKFCEFFVNCLSMKEIEWLENLSFDKE